MIYLNYIQKNFSHLLIVSSLKKMFKIICFSLKMRYLSFVLGKTFLQELLTNKY